jgi:hypothetical protein
MTAFAPLAASGGTLPYTYSYTPAIGSSFPAGLAFDPATGIVSGTPTGIPVSPTPGVGAPNVIVFSVKDASGVVASTTSSVTFVAYAAYVAEGGLTWMPISPVTMYSFSAATSLCAGTINGMTGWRLPTEAELNALYTSAAMVGRGWVLGATTSSTVASSTFPTSHYAVDLSNGVDEAISDTLSNLVTCVR